MIRTQNTQSIAWLYDQFERKRLELDPPYQRKSVWSQQFKNNFIDTVLLNYPAPAIFLYQEIHSDGRTAFNVVDGKQRLTTVFDFVSNRFPVSDKSPVSALRGLYFNSFSDDSKKAFWSYLFSIEYLPSSDEGLISDIFDRINRNVAKLTPQELRHARLDGVFISIAEEQADAIVKKLPKHFPRLAEQSRKQMKDVEFVSSLFLLLELGPQSFSQADLDQAYLERDDEWGAKDAVVGRFDLVVSYLAAIAEIPDLGPIVVSSRLRNQVDFYSLVGAIDRLYASNELPTPVLAANRLSAFIERVEDAESREQPSNQYLKDYYDAARSASSDKGARQRRIDIVSQVIAGSLA